MAWIKTVEASSCHALIAVESAFRWHGLIAVDGTLKVVMDAVEGAFSWHAFIAVDGALAGMD